MKRILALTVGVAVVAGTVALVGQIDRERAYRRMLGQGVTELESGAGYKAIESFSGALALQPDSMVAYYQRGEAYRVQRLYDEAIRDWKTANRLAPDTPEPLVALGEVYALLGEPALAAERYADAARLLKDEDPALLYALALARYRSGAPAAAVDPLQRALARNDSIAEAHYLLGLVYRDTHDTARAIASLERAISIAPDQSLIAAREELADLYRATGRAADEFLQLQSLSMLDPEVDRQIAIALAQARRGEYAVALTALRDAASDAPLDSRIHVASGRVHLMRAERTGDPLAAAQARAALETALEGKARRSEDLALLGRAVHLSGDYEEAERILGQAVSTSPVDRAAFAYLADTAERLSHELVARDALLTLDLLEANTAQPDQRAARNRRIGALSLAGGDTVSALRYLGRAVDDGHDDASTLALLAGAQWSAGQEDAARRTLARALSRDPDNADVVRWSMTIR